MNTRQIADPSDPIEIRNAMIADERAAGATLVTPGEMPWLSTEDWLDDAVVTLLGKDVRLVWLNAREPGKGAFTRLIAGIEAADLRPVVIDPLPDGGHPAALGSAPADGLPGRGPSDALAAAQTGQMS